MTLLRIEQGSNQARFGCRMGRQKIAGQRTLINHAPDLVAFQDGGRLIESAVTVMAEARVAVM